MMKKRNAEMIQPNKRIMQKKFNEQIKHLLDS